MTASRGVMIAFVAREVPGPKVFCIVSNGLCGLLWGRTCSMRSCWQLKEELDDWCSSCALRERLADCCGACEAFRRGVSCWELGKALSRCCQQQVQCDFCALYVAHRKEIMLERGRLKVANKRESHLDSNAVATA